MKKNAQPAPGWTGRSCTVTGPPAKFVRDFFLSAVPKEAPFSQRQGSHIAAEDHDRLPRRPRLPHR